jgi:hypothetical protein
VHLGWGEEEKKPADFSKEFLNSLGGELKLYHFLAPSKTK